MSVLNDQQNCKTQTGTVGGNAGLKVFCYRMLKDKDSQNTNTEIDFKNSEKSFIFNESNKYRICISSISHLIKWKTV